MVSAVTVWMDMKEIVVMSIMMTVYLILVRMEGAVRLAYSYAYRVFSCASY